MDAEVIPLRAYQTARELEADKPERLPLVVSSSPGAVSFLLGAGDDELELWLAPEQADELADDLRRVAAAAREAGRAVRRG